jgi:hypothetical protein
MAISIDSAPSSSIRSYSGDINSILIQTEDGRRSDASIKYNRIRDYSTTVYLDQHYQTERPRSGKPIILLALALFVTAWLFSESNLFAVIPLIESDRKFGKPKVENSGEWGDWVQSFYEAENSTDVGDALDEDDDHLQSDLEIDEVQTAVGDKNSTDGDGDDDDLLGEDDNFEASGEESMGESVEESANVSATNISATSTTKPIHNGENATKYNL